MVHEYNITHKGLRLEEVLAQIKALDSFPCTVKLYDRVFTLLNKEEAWAIKTGIEVGWFLAEESK